MDITVKMEIFEDKKKVFSRTAKITDVISVIDAKGKLLMGTWLVKNKTDEYIRENYNKKELELK